MSTIELAENKVTLPAPPAAQPLSPPHILGRDNSRIAGAGLLVTDAVLLAATSWAASPSLILLAALPVLTLYTAAGLYPGFGVMSCERLRRRWLLGAPFILTSMVASWQAGALIAAYLLISPLAEAFMRHMLHRLQLWGKPAMLNGDAGDMLRHNWYLGLNPAPQAGTLVLFQGAKPHPDQASVAEVFLAHEGAALARIRPLDNSLLRWLGTARSQNPQDMPFKTVKRATDVVVSAALLVATLPIMLACMLAVYIADPGPVIYTQFRRGQFGNPVRIYKLRSMYLDSSVRLEQILSSDADAAANWSERFKLQPDPRVLPFIGGFIRSFSIDELPQLINVLTGEMSLIGPRIFIDYDLEVYSPELLKLRQSVPAGLTGLWQVSVRSCGNNADKVRYDAAYIRRWSLWQDTDILYRTVGAVLTGRGAG